MVPPKQFKMPEELSDQEDLKARLVIRWPELFKHSAWRMERLAMRSEVAQAELKEHALSLVRKQVSEMRDELADEIIDLFDAPEDSEVLYILSGKECEDVENAACIDPEYAAYLESRICAFLSDGDGDVSDVAKAWYKKRKVLN